VVAEGRREGLRRLDIEDVLRAVQQSLSVEFGLALYALIILRPGLLLKTTSGKVQRRLTRELYLSGSLEGVLHSWKEGGSTKVENAQSVQEQNVTADSANVPKRPIRTEIRSWLINAVARAAHRPSERVNPAEPLSDLGLDSVKLVSLTGEFSEWLGWRVEPSVVYDYPSINALAQHFSAHDGVSKPNARVEPSGGATPIAIIGMACRFPGASSIDEFWKLLTDGRDAIVEVPTERWDVSSSYAASIGRTGLSNSRWGGFVSGVENFDPLFFGISPLEAPTMDPQQRWLMMTAWEALECAAIAPTSLAGSSAGIVVGIDSTDYGRIVTRNADTIEGFSVTGTSFSIAANRISYFLNIHGPSLALDAACASSLAALHLACQYLRTGTSDLMLVGAVNAILTPESMIAVAQAGLLSPDGRCHTFDDSANGYVRGEGCGVARA